MSSATNPPGSAGPLKPVVKLPDYLAKLPNIGFITRPAKSSAESEQPGVLINMTSLEELAAAAQRHFNRRNDSK